MKSIVAFAALLLAVCSSLADPPPEEVAGVPWGSSASKIREILAKRPGITYEPRDSSSSDLNYYDGKFAGLDVQNWHFSIGDRGLFLVRVILKSTGEKEAAFKTMKRLISEKYGGGRAVSVGTRPPPAYDWIRSRWVNRGASNPPDRTTWDLDTLFTRHHIQIVCQPDGGNRAFVEYVNQSLAKPPPEPTRPLSAPADPKRTKDL